MPTARLRSVTGAIGRTATRRFSANWHWRSMTPRCRAHVGSARVHQGLRRRAHRPGVVHTARQDAAGGQEAVSLPPADARLPSGGSDSAGIGRTDPVGPARRAGSGPAAQRLGGLPPLAEIPVLAAAPESVDPRQGGDRLRFEWRPGSTRLTGVPVLLQLSLVRQFTILDENGNYQRLAWAGYEISMSLPVGTTLEGDRPGLTRTRPQGVSRSSGAPAPRRSPGAPVPSASVSTRKNEV